MTGRQKHFVRTGDRFGRGTVLAEIRIPRPDRPGGERGFQLMCDCGTVYRVRLTSLITESVQPTQSCGCLARETAASKGRSRASLDRLATYARSPEGRANTTVRSTVHGLRQHPLYATWASIKSRCYNPRSKAYKNYGARGIVLFDRWHDPRLFIEDILWLIGPRPARKTLDRKDNDGPYAPDNVRWADRVTQVHNSRKFIDGTRSGPIYQLWWRLMRKYPGEVCLDWHGFPGFLASIENSIGPCPPGMRFCRVDDSKLYGPGNVAWVTGAEQVRRAQAARHPQ